eukprot:g1768.t1
MEESKSNDTVPSRYYYLTYFGHEVRYLHRVRRGLLKKDYKRFIYLAGDSTLDNKFWFEEEEKALNGYEGILKPPKMKKDVCYWLNREVLQRQLPGLACINTAVEATSLNSRSFCHLLEQDRFIRDNITEEDYLIVSVGGNDVALNPVLFTVLNILPLLCCTPMCCLENCACACPPNCKLDTGCLGCGLPGCLAGTLTGFPLGLSYFVDMFKNRVENYIARMVSKRKPKKILVCMLYYPDTIGRGGWADPALGALGYNVCPNRLHTLIRIVFRLATSRIHIPGSEIVPVPMWHAMDGTDTSDYEQRVEPSASGGAKLAKLFIDYILDSTPKATATFSDHAPGSGDTHTPPEAQAFAEGEGGPTLRTVMHTARPGTYDSLK